jgi:hypothetical protein
MSTKARHRDTLRGIALTLLLLGLLGLEAQVAGAGPATEAQVAAHHAPGAGAVTEQ